MIALRSFGLGALKRHLGTFNFHGSRFRTALFAIVSGLVCFPPNMKLGDILALVLSTNSGGDFAFAISIQVVPFTARVKHVVFA